MDDSFNNSDYNTVQLICDNWCDSECSAIKQEAESCASEQCNCRELVNNKWIRGATIFKQRRKVTF